MMIGKPGVDDAYEGRCDWLLKLAVACWHW
jgi:hypothetical protein